MSSRGRGDAGLAEDLEAMADRREPGARTPWVAIGRLVERAEALRAQGDLSADNFAAIRQRALALVSSLPDHRQTEALASLDAIDPRRARR